MNSVSGVGVIDKSAMLLGALVDGPADLIEVQRRTGLPRATAHRLLLALEVHRLVRRDDGGRFCLGEELLRLADAAQRSFPIAALARPVLEQLRQDTGESAQLYVREGVQRRCLVSLPSHHALRWTLPEGALLSMERGSAGRVLEGGTALAESVEEREPGVASVSAAVLDRRGVVVAAVGISGPVERLSRSPIERFGRAVEQAAERLSNALR